MIRISKNEIIEAYIVSEVCVELAKPIKTLVLVPTVWKGQNSGLFPVFFQANIHYSRVNLTHSNHEKMADILQTAF